MHFLMPNKLIVGGLITRKGWKFLANSELWVGQNKLVLLEASVLTFIEEVDLKYKKRANVIISVLVDKKKSNIKKQKSNLQLLYPLLLSIHPLSV